MDYFEIRSTSWQDRKPRLNETIVFEVKPSILKSKIVVSNLCPVVCCLYYVSSNCKHDFHSFGPFVLLRCHEHKGLHYIIMNCNFNPRPFVFRLDCFMWVLGNNNFNTQLFVSFKMLGYGYHYGPLVFYTLISSVSKGENRECSFHLVTLFEECLLHVSCIQFLLWACEWLHCTTRGPKWVSHYWNAILSFIQN